MSEASKLTFTDKIEENLIALILGLMTLITFVNVVVRYVFNAEVFQPITVALHLPTQLLWGLELTTILFAWLVILGISYCVKTVSHLGVDAVLNLMPKDIRRAMAYVSVLCCIIYAFLLFKGGWDFWSNFANLPQTTGRWFPTGFEADFLGKGWYETNDIDMPPVFQFLATWFNDGEAYEKLPRLVPYFVLPVGFGLLLFRFCQLGLSVVRGTRDLIIVSHEAEDAVEEAAAMVAADEQQNKKEG
ncbi:MULTISPECIES: TRAP transporter small permease [unclassified Lentilitoribacter]|jgi:C4-dicarboxylate transporter DctQ subunit|uniref:TRAP transporter small permease n=1 Tax=unclassified Lentilitoribacter TaxID=2647570 RepID=UPI0013A6F3F5|nr:TRAP transporter small permease [Lentilitoribacter sp. Alg239-R112]